MVLTIDKKSYRKCSVGLCTVRISVITFLIFTTNPDVVNCSQSIIQTLTFDAVSLYKQ